MYITKWLPLNTMHVHSKIFNTSIAVLKIIPQCTMQIQGIIIKLTSPLTLMKECKNSSFYRLLNKL